MNPTIRRMLCASALLGFGAAARAYDLTVEVVNAGAEKGNIAAALYGSEASWMKGALSGERQPAAARTALVFRNLPAGRYALSLYHDENGNGKLDTNIAGIPTEHYGFSRDARGHMSPPSFADAAIDLRADTAITVHLR